VPARDLLAGAGGIVLLYAVLWFLATRRLRSPDPSLVPAGD
jgi:hypothetical protein